MMNQLSCGSMFLPSKGNAWSATMHTAASIDCCCCEMNFNCGLHRSKRNSARWICTFQPDIHTKSPYTWRWSVARMSQHPPTRGRTASSFPGNYFCPQRSCPHIATEPVRLQVRVMRRTEAIETVGVAGRWKTQPPEAHMEFGRSKRWDCWGRKPGAENLIARIRCLYTDGSC